MVFKVKIEPDSSGIYKARLVIKGYLQRYGLDYDETFAPTITFGTILLVLHIAATENW
jgi:inner membrane protein involved in colicin E2 resistance